MALTEEERHSVEEEKQLFLNEIGLKDVGLKTIFVTFDSFVWREAFALNDEHRQSIEEGRSRWFKTFEEYEIVKEWNAREKNQNSIPPAA